MNVGIRALNEAVLILFKYPSSLVLFCIVGNLGKTRLGIRLDNQRIGPVCRSVSIAEHSQEIIC